ncbi:MAG: hypothetical protein LUQ13_00190 [Methanomicrobiales archaeon]|nr:hypothetical protein [Methanomicrobiales archaeon]
MDVRNTVRIVLGTIFLLGGFIYLFIEQPLIAIPPILITAGLVYIIVGILRHRRGQNGPEQDERTRKIAVLGMAYSWRVSIFGIAIFFWVDYFGVYRLNGYTAFGLAAIILALSAIGFQRYFARRGDPGL